MALTTEPEITAPVDLCVPGERVLNPQARGWSRRPLHNAELRGGWGRTKRWDYWAILGPDFFVSLTYADVDYLGIVSVEWGEFANGRSGGRALSVPLARGISLPDVSGSRPLQHRSSNLDLDITELPGGTRIVASWTESAGKGRGSIDVVVAHPPAHESLNVVIPWSDRRFQFTSKHQARPVAGTIEFDGQVRSLGSDGVEAWGVLDVGRGRWPYSTRWNWGGGAGRLDDGRVVGLQFGGKWTEGTGFTENGILIDGRLIKLGDELEWTYSWDEPMKPWRVRSATSGLDVTLTPAFDRHARTNLLVLSTEVHQVFGRWSGEIPDDGGGLATVRDIVGFAEESRSRW